MSRTYRKDSQSRHEFTKRRRDRGTQRDNRWSHSFSSTERPDNPPTRGVQRTGEPKRFPDTGD